MSDEPSPEQIRAACAVLRGIPVAVREGALAAEDPSVDEAIAIAFDLARWNTAGRPGPPSPVVGDPIVFEDDAELAQLTGLTRRAFVDRCRGAGRHEAIARAARTPARGWSAPLSAIRDALERETAARPSKRRSRPSNAPTVGQAPTTDGVRTLLETTGGAPRRAHGGPRAA